MGRWMWCMGRSGMRGLIFGCGIRFSSRRGKRLRDLGSLTMIIRTMRFSLLSTILMATGILTISSMVFQARPPRSTSILVKRWTEWKKHPLDMGSGGAQIHVYDVDGDGKNDIITSLAAHGTGLAWFKQMGKDDKGEIKWEKHSILPDKYEANEQGIKFSQLHAVD